MIKDALTFKEKENIKIDKEYMKSTERITLNLSIFPITAKEVVYLTQEPR